MTTPLISADALQALLPEGPLLLDWRFDLADAQAGARAYAAGHIAGAHYLHLDEACGPKMERDGRFRGRHPLPEREDFARLLQALGWRYDRPVVCYDGGNSMFAARGWWMLRWLGHEQVQVLDGGLAAWTAAGGTLSTEAASVPFAPEAFELRAPLLRSIDRETLRAQLGRVGLVDARAPERFRGEVEPLDRQAGHIPGARNRPFALNLQLDGRFKPAEQLREEWQALHPDADTVQQCGSGVTACHNLLSLAVAGLPLGPLYGGSWSEWSADPTLPLART
jgi:thiosulfate/3-mercaptopyruvate sulfurtransferase